MMLINRPIQPPPSQPQPLQQPTESYLRRPGGQPEGTPSAKLIISRMSEWRPGERLQELNFWLENFCVWWTQIHCTQ